MQLGTGSNHKSISLSVPKAASKFNSFKFKNSQVCYLYTNTPRWPILYLHFTMSLVLYKQKLSMLYHRSGGGERGGVGQPAVDDVPVPGKGSAALKKQKMTSFSVAAQVGDNTPLARSWRESSGDSSVIAPVIVTVQGETFDLYLLYLNTVVGWLWPVFRSFRHTAFFQMPNNA